MAVMLTAQGMTLDVPGNSRSADYANTILVPATTGNTFITLYTTPNSKLAILRNAFSHTDSTTTPAQAHARVYTVRAGVLCQITAAVSATIPVNDRAPVTLILRPGDLVQASYDNYDSVSIYVVFYAHIDEIDS